MCAISRIVQGGGVVVFVFMTWIRITGSIFSRTPSLETYTTKTWAALSWLIRKYSLLCWQSDFFLMFVLCSNCFLPVVSGRKSPVWLRVWHECHWLLRDSRLTKLDELFRGVLWLRGECSGLLPDTHGHPVQLCRLLFTAVSVCVC